MRLQFRKLEHIGVYCLLRRNLAILLFMGTKIALAQKFSFIFFKDECGWV
jgi:hypothetical protein